MKFIWCSGTVLNRQFHLVDSEDNFTLEEKIQWVLHIRVTVGYVLQRPADKACIALELLKGEEKNVNTYNAYANVYLLSMLPRPMELLFAK